MDMRYEGTDTLLRTREPQHGNFGSSFTRQYRQEYGFVLQGRPLCVDNLRVRAVFSAQRIKRVPIEAAGDDPPPCLGTVPAWLDGAKRSVPLYRLQQLAAGHCLPSPCIILQSTRCCFPFPPPSLCDSCTCICRCVSVWVCVLTSLGPLLCSARLWWRVGAPHA